MNKAREKRQEGGPKARVRQRGRGIPRNLRQAKADLRQRIILGFIYLRQR